MSLLSQLASRPLGGSIATIPIVVPAATEIPSVAVDRPFDDFSSSSDRSLEDAQFLIRALLCDGHADDDDFARLEAAVDEHIDVWTPAVHTSSRHELVSALIDVDDAIGDVEMTFTTFAVGRSTVLLEWVATGRFCRAAFLGDDQLLEPTGAVVRLVGAASVSFSDGRRAERIRCCYDRLTLIEQMLASAPGAVRG